MKNATIVLITVLGVALVGGIAYQMGAFSFLVGAPESGPSTSAPSAVPSGGGSGGKQRIVALGRVEPSGGVVDIATMVGDRIDQILVEEGQEVNKGAVLAQLESRTARKLQYEAAESQLAEAEARYQAEEKLAEARIIGADLSVSKAETTDMDIEAQQKKVELAKANLALAVKDQERLAELKKSRTGLVSDQEAERQDLVVQQARAELTAGEAMLDKLIRTKKLSLEGARADAEAARATKQQVLAAIPVESLRKQRDLALQQYDDTEVKAPEGGTVLKVFLRRGETIAHTPILQMADLTKITVVAEVYETDSKWIKKGQKAVIQSKAFDSPYDEKGLVGEVQHVAGMITTPALRNLDPMASADRRVVEVRIGLDEANSRQAADLINLQVDVTILPEGSDASSSDLPQEP